MNCSGTSNDFWKSPAICFCQLLGNAVIIAIVAFVYLFY